MYSYMDSLGTGMLQVHVPGYGYRYKYRYGYRYGISEWEIIT